MSLWYEFIDTYISHLTQRPMINMAIKWHHMNVCNKVVIWRLFTMVFGLFNHVYSIQTYEKHIPHYYYCQIVTH
jgi:hypothetical protein